jgi:peroxiredoxin
LKSARLAVARYYPAFRESNAEIIGLSTVGLKSLTAFAHRLALPFPILSDVNGGAYRAFGLGKGLTIRPRTVVTAVQLAWREKRLYRPVGDVMPVGGDFIVDGEGIIRFAHSSEDPTDRPDATDLLRLIDSLQ